MNKKVMKACKVGYVPFLPVDLYYICLLVSYYGGRGKDTFKVDGGSKAFLKLEVDWRAIFEYCIKGVQAVH